MNYGHPLAQGLVFAGLGELPNSSYYHDSSLYKNSGTLTNMSIPATATSGWAWDNYLGRWACGYNSTASNYISFGSFGKAGQGTGMTIAGWVYIPAISAQYCIGLQDYSYHVGGVALQWLTSSYLKLSCGRPTSDTTVQVAYATTNAGKWHHIAVTGSGTTATFYVDGVSLGTGDLPAAVWTNVGTGNSGNAFGYFGAGTYMNGIMSDPCRWIRPLSASEISALADPSNVMLSGLLLPPRRRLYAAGAAAAGFKPYWARRQQQICGAL